MIPIEKRLGLRDTHAFVVAETVDLLADKLVGVLADRRMTKVHRYLGETSGTPRVFPGLRVDRGSRTPITRHPGQSVRVHLASQPRRMESVGIWVDGDESERDAARRYHAPEKEWLGQRRNLTRVELEGWPRSPSTEDRVVIEHWNEHGVGQETVLAFDDVDLIQELAWDIKGDTARRVEMWNETCDHHGLHFEHPDHGQGSDCRPRPSTRAEDLSVLALLAASAERVR